MYPCQVSDQVWADLVGQYGAHFAGPLVPGEPVPDEVRDRIPKSRCFCGCLCVCVLRGLYNKFKMCHVFRPVLLPGGLPNGRPRVASASSKDRDVVASLCLARRLMHVCCFVLCFREKVHSPITINTARYVSINNNPCHCESFPEKQRGKIHETSNSGPKLSLRAKIEYYLALAI